VYSRNYVDGHNGIQNRPDCGELRVIHAINGPRPGPPPAQPHVVQDADDDAPRNTEKCAIQVHAVMTIETDMVSGAANTVHTGCSSEYPIPKVFSGQQRQQRASGMLQTSVDLQVILNVTASNNKQCRDHGPGLGESQRYSRLQPHGE
jgi:hypothetical protein